MNLAARVLRPGPISPPSTGDCRIAPLVIATVARLLSIYNPYFVVFSRSIVERSKPVTDEDATYYQQTPSEFASDLMQIKQAGANMVGGCCGTNPEFIQAMVGAISA